MHHDEKGKISPAQSKLAKSMNGNGKAKKVAKMETIRGRQPSHGEGGWKGVEKSGSYRKALARNLRRA